MKPGVSLGSYEAAECQSGRGVELEIAKEVVEITSEKSRGCGNLKNKHNSCWNQMCFLGYYCTFII